MGENVELDTLKKSEDKTVVKDPSKLYDENGNVIIVDIENITDDNFFSPKVLKIIKIILVVISVSIIVGVVIYLITQIDGGINKPKPKTVIEKVDEKVDEDINKNDEDEFEQINKFVI